MNKLVVSIVSFLLCSLYSFSQELVVKSFELSMNPMTVPMQRKDNNGNICALVKVIIPDSKAVFEGNIIGNCDFKTSEYWCYLTPGSKYLKIKYPGLKPLLVNFEQFIGTGVKGTMIYELLLELPPTNQTDMTFTIKGKIDREEPNEKGYYYGEKIPYTPGYTLYKNYLEGNYEGKWDLSLGSYEISDIRIGDKLTLFAKDERYEPQTIVVEQKNIGNSDFKFFLRKKRVNLKGYLVDSETNEPILGAEVSADNNSWYKVDDYGYFTIENLVIDKIYSLHCRNTPIGYLTYEDPKVVPILCPQLYGWGIKRNSISAWIDLNGVSPTKIKAWCEEGHEATVDQGYDTDKCYVHHPHHSKKPRLTIKCEGFKTIVIDFESFLTTPKPVKFKKGNENEFIHYRTISKGYENVLQQVKQ